MLSLQARVSIIGVSVVAGILVANSAMACLVDKCDLLGQDAEDFFLPVEGSTVPANLTGLWAASLRDYGPVEIIEIVDNSDPEVAVGISDESIVSAVDSTWPVGWSHDFDAFLKEGHSYRLRSRNSCTGDVSEVTFEASAVAPLPTSLGELELFDNFNGPLSLDCTAEIQASQAHFGLVLAEEALPWKEVINFVTYVNDMPWYARSHTAQVVPIGSSWVGRGEDLVFANCSGTAGGLDEGVHTVQIRGYLPGVDEPILSDELEVVLNCDGYFGGTGCSGTGGIPGPFAFLLLAAGCLILRSSRS